MAKVTIRWSPRVPLDRIRRLYRDYLIGISDEEMLLEVGEGLYARALDVVKVWRAYCGEVPCPECGTLILRTRHFRPKWVAPPERTFLCSTCRATLTWNACRGSLTGRPLCFACLNPLTLNYSDDQYHCTCGKAWGRHQYAQSVKGRIRLPCPHCLTWVKRPDTHIVTEAAPQRPAAEVLCVKCRGCGRHADGKFTCPHCGHEEQWQKYWQKLKHRAEYLHCVHCGCRFTWEAWRKQVNKYLMTGNPRPAEEYAPKWPLCSTTGEKILRIDFLLHALHGRGPLAALFLEGDEHTVSTLLDELASQQ